MPSNLQEKPSALKKEHSALLKFINCFLFFWVILPSLIRIRIQGPHWIRIQSGSRSTTPGVRYRLIFENILEIILIDLTYFLANFTVPFRFWALFLDFMNSKRNSNSCRICIEPAEGEGWLPQLLAQEENKTKNAPKLHLADKVHCAWIIVY